MSELTKLLDSSESTIRRDLSALDEMGKLTKVFGGATSITRNEGVFEDAVSTRETVMSDEKDAVAEYCAKLIHDSDFVYIDAGTTTLKLVDHITNTNATYVTNGTHNSLGKRFYFSAYYICLHTLWISILACVMPFVTYFAFVFKFF